MSKFTTEFDDAKKEMSVRLSGDFSQEDWDALLKYYRPCIEAGTRNWVLDLRDIKFAGSLFIGMIAAFSTSVRAHEGSFEVISRVASPVTNQLRFARLDRILTLREI